MNNVTFHFASSWKGDHWVQWEFVLNNQPTFTGIGGRRGWFGLCMGSNVDDWLFCNEAGEEISACTAKVRVE